MNFTRKTIVAFIACTAMAFGANAQNKKTDNQAETAPAQKEVQAPAETKPAVKSETKQVTKEGGKAVTTPAGSKTPNESAPETPPAKQPMKGSTPSSANQIDNASSVDKAPTKTLDPNAAKNKKTQKTEPAKKGN